MFTNSHHIGLVDPYEVEEPPANSQGFVIHNYLQMNQGNNIVLSFQSGTHPILLAYMNWGHETDITGVGDILTFKANGATIADIYTTILGRNQDPKVAKLNIILPPLSLITVEYFAAGVGPFLTYLFLTGWRILR